MNALLPSRLPDPETGWDKDKYNTPPEILDRVYNIGPIGLDPCSNSASLVQAKRCYDLELRGEDGLILPWSAKGLVFVNPPYSTQLFRRFGDKIGEEALGGTEIVALIPANVETQPWTRVFWYADAICFVSHRLKFFRDYQADGTAGFASAVVYFGPQPELFKNAFKDLGKIIFPNLEV